MGTNYYLHSKPCCQCGNVEMKKHIGKCSADWSFSFRGYDCTPRSYKEWLLEFKNPRAIIKDEYGDVISIEDFKIMVGQLKDGLNHARIFTQNPANEKELEVIKKTNFEHLMSYGRNLWIDEEGHSFSGHEFC